MTVQKRVFVVNSENIDEYLDANVAIEVNQDNPVFWNRKIVTRHKDICDSKRVIEAYAQWIESDLAEGGPVSVEIMNLVNKVKKGERVVLTCWCHPLPCCADCLAKVIVKLASE
jgi:hypothetical protein